MLEDFRIQIYADGARYEDIEVLAHLRDADSGEAIVRGFTTNPSLMARAGVSDYRAFARGALDLADGRPVSFEVLADDVDGILRQAEEIASWSPDAWVKIPIVNTRGAYNVDVLRSLVARGINVNVTAVFTAGQLHDISSALVSGVEAAGTAERIIISVFAGRVADAGRSPLNAVIDCVEVLGNWDLLDASVLWASPRQVYDVVLAEQSGCDIITLPPDLIAKLHLFGKDLNEFSRETVQMFDGDARASGITL